MARQASTRSRVNQQAFFYTDMSYFGDKGRFDGRGTHPRLDDDLMALSERGDSVLLATNCSCGWRSRDLYSEGRPGVPKVARECWKASGTGVATRTPTYLSSDGDAGIL